MSVPSPEIRRETEAALAARRELGPEYDDAIAAGLAERVEQLALQRSAELRSQAAAGQHDTSLERTGQHQRFVLGIISLGAGIPVTAISASNVEPGLLGVAVAWAGIVGVNVAFALSNRAARR
jgi:hypothetical protein